LVRSRAGKTNEEVRGLVTRLELRGVREERGKWEVGSGKREEGRGKREEGRGKREEGREEKQAGRERRGR
jgi:hypothetical protein